jgi:hypothetical protein
MSTTKSSKKSTKEVIPKEVTIQEEVSEKKVTKKSSKSKKVAEAPDNTVSDSDKSFIDTLNQSDLEKDVEKDIPSEIKTDDKIENKKVQYFKKFDTLLRNFKSFANIGLEELNLNEDDKKVIIIKYNEMNEYQLICQQRNNSLQNGKEYVDFKGKKKASKAKVQEVDENGVAIKKDTSNAPVNRLRETYPQVLEFMEKEPDTLVSITEVQSAIRKFKNEQKAQGNVENNVTGKLETLFTFTMEEAKKCGHKIESDATVPKSIGDKDIFKYAAYCFPKVQKA